MFLFYSIKVHLFLKQQKYFFINFSKKQTFFTNTIILCVYFNFKVNYSLFFNIKTLFKKLLLANCKTNENV